MDRSSTGCRPIHHLTALVIFLAAASLALGAATGYAMYGLHQMASPGDSRKGGDAIFRDCGLTEDRRRRLGDGDGDQVPPGTQGEAATHDAH